MASLTDVHQYRVPFLVLHYNYIVQQALKNVIVDQLFNYLLLL